MPNPNREAVARLMEWGGGWDYDNAEAAVRDITPAIEAEVRERLRETINAIPLTKAVEMAKAKATTYWECSDGGPARFADALYIQRRELSPAIEEKARSGARERLSGEAARRAAFQKLTEGNYMTFTDPEGQEEYVWAIIDAVLDAALDQEAEGD